LALVIALGFVRARAASTDHAARPAPDADAGAPPVDSQPAKPVRRSHPYPLLPKRTRPSQTFYLDQPEPANRAATPARATRSSRAEEQDGAGAIEPPATAAAPTDTTPPTVPRGARAVAVSPTEIVITWMASSDDVAVAGYEVSHGGQVFRDTRDLVASETDLVPWHEYCYTVRAYDAAGNRSARSDVTCARTLDESPPGPPARVVARAMNATEIELSWGESTDDSAMVRYEVTRDGVEIAVGSTTNATERGLEPSREYCYDVVAVDGAGNRSEQSRACTRTQVLRPAAPAELTVIATSASEVVLEWKASSGGVGALAYEVIRGGNLVEKTTDLYASESALPPGNELCYRVRAIDAAGTRSVDAGPLCARTPTDRSHPAAPQRVRATPTARGILLEWSPPRVADVTYSVRWEKDRPIGETPHPTFLVLGTKPGEQHCFRVKSIDREGRSSPPSLPACAARVADTAISGR
jgi:chitodextrinase